MRIKIYRTLCSIIAQLCAASSNIICPDEDELGALNTLCFYLTIHFLALARGFELFVEMCKSSEEGAKITLKRLIKC